MVEVAITTTAAGVTAVVEAGEAYRVLVWLRAPPRGQLWSNNQGSCRSFDGGNGGRRNGARGRSAWDGSSTSSRSSSFASTDDQSEVAVVAGKRCQESCQEEHQGIRLLPSCCAC